MSSGRRPARRFGRWFSGLQVLAGETVRQKMARRPSDERVPGTSPAACAGDVAGPGRLATPHLPPLLPPPPSEPDLLGGRHLFGGWHLLGASRLLTARLLFSASLLTALLSVAGCREKPRPVDVPVFPGAEFRPAESAFQERLLSILLSPGARQPRVQVYRTEAAFSAVLGFYEPHFAPGSLVQRRFAVASRIAQLAEGARAGRPQPVAVGRLLFTRRGAPGDSLAAPAVANSMAALADRLQGVEGLIALGRIPLATAPASEALVSIEHPHLDASELRVDSLTVVTVAVTAGR
jgi:hypothetical protein